VEESGEIHAPRCRRPAQLAARLDQDCFRAEAARLDRGDGAGRAAADHQHVGREPAQGWRRLRGDEHAAGGKGSERGEKMTAFHGSEEESEGSWGGQSFHGTVVARSEASAAAYALCPVEPVPTMERADTGRCALWVAISGASAGS